MRYLFCFVLFIAQQSSSQQVMPLYTGEIPNSRPAANIESSTKDKNGYVIIRDISIPTLTMFLPQKQKRNGAAVIICPGGGYWVNAIKHEGTDVAAEFAKNGIAAFVLKYRIPDERTMINTSIGPLQDVQQAMIMVKSHASAWSIDTSRIGVMGFSAGGHLASTMGTHTQAVVSNPAGYGLRPAFMMLIYPMITSDSAVNNRGLIEKLIGRNAPPELWKKYSNEKQVTPQTPASFIVQSTNDDLSVRNSILFYDALLKNKVPAEMHLYQAGGHGYGLNNKTTKEKWMDRCLNWMAANNWTRLP